MPGSQNKPKIAVIGAGWAGLSTCLWLTKDNDQYDITLFEATRSIGGRARQVNWDGQHVDNGQHLLLGAYQGFIKTLNLAGVHVDDFFERAPFSWEMLDSNGDTDLSFPASNIPWPFNLLASFVNNTGLTNKELYKGLFVLHRIKSTTLQDDISVKALLNKYDLSDKWINAFYNPLCLAALNLPTEIASAQLFINTLKAAFLFRKGFADYLLPKGTLHSSFSTNLENSLLEKQVNILTATKIIDIVNKQNGFVLNTQKDTFLADYVVIATAPKTSGKLLKNIDQSLASLVAELDNSPITTIYLQYPKEIKLPKLFLGVSNSHIDWFFDRSHCGQDGLISAVISATNNRGGQIDDAAKESHRLLEKIIPALPLPLKTKICTEKNATFLATVGCEQLRPTNNAVHDRLYIAGDYTATGLPATLEGAIVSGMSVADLIRQKTL